MKTSVGLLLLLCSVWLIEGFPPMKDNKGANMDVSKFHDVLLLQKVLSHNRAKDMEISENEIPTDPMSTLLSQLRPSPVLTLPHDDSLENHPQQLHRQARTLGLMYNLQLKAQKRAERRKYLQDLKNLKQEQKRIWHDQRIQLLKAGNDYNKQWMTSMMKNQDPNRIHKIPYPLFMGTYIPLHTGQNSFKVEYSTLPTTTTTTAPSSTSTSTQSSSTNNPPVA